MIKSEQGMVAGVFFLLFIPLLVLGMLYTTDHAETVFHYDIDIQQAVTDATRAAAFTVDPLSQANANPMIVPDEAYLIFKKVLAQNLNLDEVTLKPKSGSALTKEPEYYFIVFNGENEFGLPEGVCYPSGITIDGNLPKDFQISEAGIIPDGMGNIVARLDRPGCVAMVKCTVKSITGKDSTGVRWVAAKVVK